MEENYKKPTIDSRSQNVIYVLECDVGIVNKLLIYIDLIIWLFYHFLLLLNVYGLVLCALYEFHLQCRVWQRDFRDRRALQPDVTYYPDLQPPPSYIDNAINSVTTRFVKTATNKMRCPIFCMAWTPEGRRLVTGASSGEFTLWNGLTFNFETILQVT
jgi:WD40 repeat protein